MGEVVVLEHENRQDSYQTQQLDELRLPEAHYQLEKGAEAGQHEESPQAAVPLCFCGLALAHSYRRPGLTQPIAVPEGFIQQLLLLFVSGELFLGLLEVVLDDIGLGSLAAVSLRLVEHSF